MDKPSAVDARTARFWGGFCSSAAWADGKSPAPQVRGTHQFYGITCQAEPQLDWFIFQENKLKYCGQLRLHELLYGTAYVKLKETSRIIWAGLRESATQMYAYMFIVVVVIGFYFIFYITRLQWCRVVYMPKVFSICGKQPLEIREGKRKGWYPVLHALLDSASPPSPSLVSRGRWSSWWCLP